MYANDDDLLGNASVLKYYLILPLAFSKVIVKGRDCKVKADDNFGK